MLRWFKGIIEEFKPTDIIIERQINKVQKIWTPFICVVSVLKVFYPDINVEIFAPITRTKFIEKYTTYEILERHSKFDKLKYKDNKLVSKRFCDDLISTKSIDTGGLRCFVSEDIYTTDKKADDLADAFNQMFIW